MPETPTDQPEAPQTALRIPRPRRRPRYRRSGASALPEWRLGTILVVVLVAAVVVASLLLGFTDGGRLS